MLTIESSPSKLPGIHIVRVAGEADFSGGETLDRFLHGLAKQRPRAVVIDLSGTGFMGSLGIGILVSFRKSLQAWNGQMALSGLNSGLQAALQISRLTSFMSVYPTLQEAETALAAPPAR